MIRGAHAFITKSFSFCVDMCKQSTDSTHPGVLLLDVKVDHKSMNKLSALPSLTYSENICYKKNDLLYSVTRSALEANPETGL